MPAPVLGRRSRAADNSKLTGTDPLLEELHLKIWNKKELRPTLFQEVEITRAHYDALQNKLNGKHPDRDSRMYDGLGHDVLSDKLDILKAVFPVDNNLDRVDDNDNEVDAEINLLFSFTLRYLDLSTLKLGNESDRFPLSFFLRQEYDHISELINENPHKGTGSVIVSDQPGLPVSQRLTSLADIKARPCIST